jgi:glycosyltransferase involved in cell wall biosynthesis
MSRADVTLFLEGTYPYVSGGVSSWVHQLLQAYPERRFSLAHIAPRPDSYSRRVYELPDNVIGLTDLYCRGEAPESRPSIRRRIGQRRRRHCGSSRVLRGLRSLHLSDTVDDALLEDLSAGDLPMSELLHGEETFELVCEELYPKIAPDSPFIDFFWHFRALHVPLLRLLSTEIEAAGVYHAVSTGYAGLVAAVASVRQDRPLIITEHGIYTREREIELSRAKWVRDRGHKFSSPSPLRRFWCHFFLMLSRIAYHRAARVITLSETNRRRQLADGADPAKTAVVPNGVDRVRYESERPERSGDRVRVGFVGRVVPIKDVITLIRACGLARARASLEFWIIGPEDEDPAYAARCHALADSLGLGDQLKFLGRQPMTEMYPQLDMLVLTSVSEGQPLVILEAFAAGLPVIATDVGACRELIEGSDGEDRRLGPAGYVTRVASPGETADAVVALALDPEGRRTMGDTGRQRVAVRYRQDQVVNRYDRLYTALAS